MKKMSFLFKQLQLMVILTMSIAITACSDDNSQNDNNQTNPEANIKIITNGIEGNTINVGQIVQLSVQKEAIDDELTYEWYVNNEGISTEETCSFLATEQGEYNIRIIASAGDKGWATTLTLEATPYPGKFCIINEGRYNASVNLYEAGKISTLTNALGITGTVGRLNGNNLYVVTKSSPQLSCIDSTTGTIIKQLRIDGQGSDFQLINETTGVLSSTTGIYIINLNDLSVQYRLSTERNCKDLYIANNYLFTLEENAIKVYNTSDFSFEKE